MEPWYKVYNATIMESFDGSVFQTQVNSNGKIFMEQTMVDHRVFEYNKGSEEIFDDIAYRNLGNVLANVSSGVDKRKTNGLRFVDHDMKAFLYDILCREEWISSVIRRWEDKKDGK